MFGYTINTDWGYNSDKKNGVNQNEPVVKPKSDTDGGGRKVDNIINGVQNFYNSNHENFRNHFNAAEIAGGTAEIYGALAAPFTEGASLVYSGYGASVSLYGTAGNSAMDFFDGHYDDFANRWTVFVLSAGTGKAIEKAIPNNNLKYIASAFKTYTENFVLPIFFNQWHKLF